VERRRQRQMCIRDRLGIHLFFIDRLRFPDHFVLNNGLDFRTQALF
jgi:hypothetical protein